MFEKLKALIVGLYERFMPRFWLNLKPQYQWAFGIAFVVTLYLATGLFRFGGAVTHGTRAMAAERLLALTAWSHACRRFYLVRIEASLGEIKGYREARRDQMKNQS